MTTERQLIKAGTAWREFEGRLPWTSRPMFYLAIERGEIPSVRLGRSIFVPRWALEALANGDVAGFSGRPERGQSNDDGAIRPPRHVRRNPGHVPPNLRT